MNRIKVVSHVFMGHPLVYRMHIDGGLCLSPGSKNVLVTECVFTGAGKPTLRKTISNCKALLVEWWRLRKYYS